MEPVPPEVSAENANPISRTQIIQCHLFCPDTKCLKMFSDLKTLTSHVKEQHSSTDAQHQQGQELDLNSNIVTDVTCPGAKCDQILEDKEVLQDPVKQEHNIEEGSMCSHCMLMCQGKCNCLEENDQCATTLKMDTDFGNELKADFMTGEVPPMQQSKAVCTVDQNDASNEDTKPDIESKQIAEAATTDATFQELQDDKHDELNLKIENTDCEKELSNGLPNEDNRPPSTSQERTPAQLEGSPASDGRHSMETQPLNEQDVASAQPKPTASKQHQRGTFKQPLSVISKRPLASPIVFEKWKLRKFPRSLKSISFRKQPKPPPRIKCVVPKCPSQEYERGGHVSTGLTFFRFPRTLGPRMAWRTAMGLPEDFTITRMSRVCHLHFEFSEMVKQMSGAYVLKPAVVPSVLPVVIVPRKVQRRFPRNLMFHCVTRSRERPRGRARGRARGRPRLDK